MSTFETLNSIFKPVKIKTTLKEFGTSLRELKQLEREDKQIQQNHFGDYLMIEESEDNENYRIWLNHPENVAQGEPEYAIEYCGSKNSWIWQDVNSEDFKSEHKI